MLLTILLALTLGQDTSTQVDLIDFSAETLPAYTIFHNTSVECIPHENGHATRVAFDKVDWPNIFFKAPEGAWDWSAYAGIAFSLYNPGDQSVQVAVRVDNPGGDGASGSNTAGGSVPAKQRSVLSMQFKTDKDARLWGMRGVPNGAPVGTGSKLDLSEITAFQVFLPKPQQATTLIFEHAWMIPKTALQIPFPFIDPFGQYMHADWPGKLKGETDLIARRDAEAAAFSTQAALPERDAWGGWADGPKREATGWFRTEQIDGKWWLITPDGTLFLSLGIDCVGHWSQTFVEQRDAWFAWLPDQEGPYKKFYGYHKNAHSGADSINGEGRTFGFYAANLYRKYGDTWKTDWRSNAYARLQGWGFNTVANWSAHDVYEHSTIPFALSGGISGVRRIEKGTGYWSKMIDVYAPEFPERAEASLNWAGKAHGNNPLCIGFFVDNELSWSGIQRGVLESPLDQPCRIALIDQLKETYGTIKKLNKAWKDDAESWDALRSPNPYTDASRRDLEEFLYRFAKRYFETVKGAVRKVAPNQLYLGCRFAGRPPAPVEKAASEVLDVVSYNLYFNQIPQDQWVGDDDLGKPIIIGEFHFGALDRGMFHTGLVATQDQNERAASYARYVRSVASHPAFVGCHWFQYVDEPNTGRWFDGENYNIGFVDITDTPYPELVAAAKQVHREVYPLRYGK